MQASPTAGWLSALERELKLVGAGLNGTNEPSAEIAIVFVRGGGRMRWFAIGQLGRLERLEPMIKRLHQEGEHRRETMLRDREQ